MATFHPLVLSDTERADLLAFVHRGTTRARIVTRAHILLQADAGWRDAAIMDAFQVSRETVSRVRARFAAGGVAGVLTDRRQTHRRRALTHDHWTLRLLAGKVVELGFVAHISPETIRALLKKTRSNPGNTRNGASQR